MSVTLILLLTQLAYANFTEQDANKQKIEAQRAASAADSELPPCKGLDHLDDVVRKFAPASCPKTKQLYEFQLERGRKIRENCRVTIRWMEEKLRNPAFCSSPPFIRANLKQLQELKSRARERKNRQRSTTYSTTLNSKPGSSTARPPPRKENGPAPNAGMGLRWHCSIATE